METRLLATIVPDAATAGTPMPGNVESPQRYKPALKCRFSVLYWVYLHPKGNNAALMGMKGFISQSETRIGSKVGVRPGNHPTGPYCKFLFHLAVGLSMSIPDEGAVFFEQLTNIKYFSSS